MYEELMPYWKERCKKRQAGDANFGRDMTMQNSPWTFTLRERGIYHEDFAGMTLTPKIQGTFEWVQGEQGWNCLVLGVMLFIYEPEVTL
jgi:hypothetical protein